jgi:SEC-C motif-containing protein
VLDEIIVPTAEALMRSRYTAYHQGNIDYLITTHHPTQRSERPFYKA